MDCIFCKIVNKEIKSNIIYEDSSVLVFMDINPLSKGHLLLIPKKHYENFLEIKSEDLIKMHDLSKEMYQLLKKKLNIDGLTLVQNNFLGQEVKHYHIHLIPKYHENIEEHLIETFNKLKLD